MTAAELAGFRAMGLKEAECYEVDCSRCGIVRLIAVERPDVCPICGVQREVWQRRAIVLTRRPLPVFRVTRERPSYVPRYTRNPSPYDRSYAAGLEGRYSV